MIKQISWTEYWTVLAVLCAAYYAVIILMYYRKELLDKLSGKRLAPVSVSPPPTSAPHPAGIANTRTDVGSLSAEEKLFGLTNQLMQELNPVFTKDYVKAELITALQILLRRYSELQGTAFQVSINNYIEMESKNQCSVSLSEQELRGLWNG